MDRTGTQSGKLIQGIVSILNENAYPNMSSMELSQATIYTCINIFFSSVAQHQEEQKGGKTETESLLSAEESSSGNYYSNDIKVRSIM